jgi:hypothetical protein
MPPKPKAPANESREAELERRAASRGYTIEKDDEGNIYAVLAGTRWGPMQTLDELDEFLPGE